MTKNIHKLAKVPPSIANANASKPPVTHASAYPTSAPYYPHHHPYGVASWYGAWSQAAAAAAYYGQPMHMQNHHPAYSHVSHAAMTRGGLAPKLPPTSPLQLISPMRNDGSKTLPTEATTPYHEVEDIVKSPMHSLSDVVSTPVIKDKCHGISTPETELLPPLWSTSTKPTPSAYAPHSPWSDRLPSPSLMTNTPAPNSEWNFASLGFHDTPCLPTTTPVKTSSEIETWHTNPTAATPTVV